MRCANCDNENPDGAKFCMECGAALSRQCANCGAPNPPGAKFCIECGEAIVQGAARATIREAAPSARARGPEAFRIAASAADSAMPSGEERKTVTALFADIKGSTELMEDLDPEEARALVDPALQLMINAARRFDGYIVQSTGDGIFALFGAPVAYEEHPLRALYAALRMQGEIRAYAARLRAEGRPPIEIRVGVNTGEVVVRSIRTGEQSREYTPIGHSTNLASRLQTLAPTGAIVISENTARLAAGYFDLKSMGPVRVRGVSEPVGVYEVAGLGPLRTRLQASAMRGLTKFVGRHDELVRIRRAFAQAGEGHGKLVAAVGDAGLGKSRLFHEFTAAAGSGCLVLQTFALSHGQTSSWMPVIELLKAYFAIGRNDGDRSQREKVTGKLLALDRSLDEALPYVFSLLGVLEDADALARMDPVIRRQRTIDALTQILLRESRNQPLVLVFEDLHWTDESSQQLLDTLAAEVGRSPLLMLVNYRPEYSHRWEGNSDYIELRLTPLAAESADEMLAALLGVTGPDELAELRRLILSRTSGNPLFMEEIVRALFEQKILARNGKVILVRPLEEVRLPPTVEGILAARIDRLPVDEKQLLQTLAVLGREFTLGLVSEMIPAAASNGDSSSGAEAAERMLLRLQASDFIYEEPAWPDTHYAFKHALTQEVAYNSILSERRRSLHERAAHAFEKVFAGRLDDYLTDLAYHHERCGNGREAAGYLLRAAAQAGRRFAYAEAVGYLDSALRQVDSLPEGAERDHLELELRGGLCGCLIPLKGTGVDISRDNLLRMCELSEKLGDADEHFWASFGLGFHYSMRLELDTARELGERQMSIAEDAHDPAKIAAACFALAQTLFMTGEFKAAYALAERALKLPPDLPKIPVGEIGDSRTMILTISASTLSVLGYPVRALERTREAVAVARQAGPYSLGLALTYATQIRQRLRDPEGVFEFADTLSLLCAKKGFSGWGTGATVMRCAGLVEQGRIEEALSAGEQIILKAEDGVLSTWRTVLIEAYTRQGRFAEASEQLEIAGRMARQHTLGTLTATLPLLEANLVVARDGADGEAAAERLLRHALEISQRQHAKLFELRAGVALARLWDGQGRGDDARAILAPIYGWFTEGFETVDLLEARELLGTLSGTGEMAAH